MHIFLAYFLSHVLLDHFQKLIKKMLFWDFFHKNYISKNFELKSVGEGASLILSKVLEYLGLVRNNLNYIEIL